MKPRSNVAPSVLEQIEDGIAEVQAWREGRRGLGTRSVEFSAPPTYTPEDITKARAALNMSQSEFAQLLQVSVKTVQAWEAARRSPSAGQARWIELFTGSEWIDRVRMTEPHPRAPRVAVAESVSTSAKFPQARSSPSTSPSGPQITRHLGGARRESVAQAPARAVPVEAPRAASSRLLNEGTKKKKH